MSLRVLGCHPRAQGFAVLCMALSHPGNNRARFVRDAEHCLSPSPFSHLFPSEPPGSGGQKFVCPSSCFANFAPAKSHVCWRKPPISAQKCIHKKRKKKKKKERSPGVAGKLSLRIPSVRFRSRIGGAQPIPEVLGSQ